MAKTALENVDTCTDHLLNFIAMTESVEQDDTSSIQALLLRAETVIELADNTIDACKSISKKLKGYVESL